MAREDLYAARLKHRWVAPPLQQVVQHLVLGESTIVHQALRHIDRVRRAPPTVAPALVGGTGVARARHLVPLHPVEVTREPGATFDLRPPGPVDRGRRERHGAGRSEGIEAAEEQERSEPTEPQAHGPSLELPGDPAGQDQPHRDARQRATHVEHARPARAPRRGEPHHARERDRHREHPDHRSRRKRQEVGELGRACGARGVEQSARGSGERRDRGEVTGLERVTEAQQQAEARKGEQVGRGAHGGWESTVTILPCASVRLAVAFPVWLQPFRSVPYRMRHMELTTPGVATLRRDPDQRALGDAETADAALAASGDGRAFERLYRAHVARVHSLVRRMIGPDSADDIAQDVFVRAWTKLPTFRGEAAFGTWLHRLAVNVILARRTTLSTERGRYHDSADILDGVAGRPAAPELSMDFEEAIGQLPDGARQVFVLHDIEGYRHEEIADMLGIVPGTSKSQLHHARMALRRHLER